MIDVDVDFYATEQSLDARADDEARERWKIDGKKTADWALAVIRRSEQEIKDAKEIAQERIDRSTAHYTEVLRREEQTINFMTGKLEEWYESYLVPEGLVSEKKKTYSNLENGSLKKHAGGLSLDVKEPEKLIAWLEENKLEKCVKTVPEQKFAMKTEIRNLFPRKKGTDALIGPGGEVIPGASYKRGDETFLVETA